MGIHLSLSTLERGWGEVSLVLCTLLCILLLAIPDSAIAQEPEYPLTISSVLPRFAESPFETDDYFVEILEYTGNGASSEQVALAFWGANAPAYPNLVRSLQWHGSQLAMIFEDRDNRETIAIWNVDDSSLTEVLTPDAGFSHLSPLDWSTDGTSLLFSAVDKLGKQQILRLTVADSELKYIAEGSLPTFSPDAEQIAFLNTDGKLSVLSFESGGIRTFDLNLIDVNSLAWSPDGEFIAVTSGAYLVNIDTATGRNLRIFDAYYHLGIDAAVMIEVSSAAWSPDSQKIAIILTAPNLSQVVLVDRETYITEVIAERDFSESPPTDPRRFIAVTFQERGAFLPSREERSDL